MVYVLGQEDLIKFVIYNLENVWFSFCIFIFDIESITGIYTLLKE